MNVNLAHVHVCLFHCSMRACAQIKHHVTCNVTLTRQAQLRYYCKSFLFAGLNNVIGNMVKVLRVRQQARSFNANDENLKSLQLQKQNYLHSKKLSQSRFVSLRALPCFSQVTGTPYNDDLHSRYPLLALPK